MARSTYFRSAPMARRAAPARTAISARGSFKNARSRLHAARAAYRHRHHRHRGGCGKPLGARQRKPTAHRGRRPPGGAFSHGPKRGSRRRPPHSPAGEARVAGRPIRWRADLSGYRFWVAGPNAAPIAEELARERRWPFEVRRIAGPELVFGREALREPAGVEITTSGPVLRLSLDAMGNAQVSSCEGAECAASR